MNMQTKTMKTRLMKCHTSCYGAMALMMFFTLIASGSVIAQSNSKGKSAVAFVNSASDHTVPLGELVKEPTLVSRLPGCEVSRFAVSFLPKEGNLFGPFKIEGASLGENQVNFLKAFTNMKVRIFVEDIHLDCAGKDSIAMAAIFTSIP